MNDSLTDKKVTTAWTNVYSNKAASSAGLGRSDKHALALSENLQQVIRAEISANAGHVSFARFMQMALYEPGLGYYSAGSHKIGKGGDFVTAPEISCLFSACVARQCAEVMRDLQPAVIMELGAGTGVMARDVLLELQKLACLPAKYCILEPSADLRQRQQQLLRASLPELFAKVYWLQTLPAKPITGVILANEVLDALPVQRFCLLQNKIKALHVSWQADRFIWQQYAADGVLEQQVKAIIHGANTDFSEGYTSEVNTDLPVWIQSLAACLRQGVMLFVDYGYSRHEYYHAQRTQGTLLCHYRQRVHADPFIHVGLQDITASVDFTAVADAAVSADLKVAGFTTQAGFLLACGLEQLLQAQRDIDELQRLELGRQVKLLTLPGEMGERFKVMALSRNMDTALAGFSLIDHRRRL